MIGVRVKEWQADFRRRLATHKLRVDIFTPEQLMSIYLDSFPPLEKACNAVRAKNKFCPRKCRYCDQTATRIYPSDDFDNQLTYKVLCEDCRRDVESGKIVPVSLNRNTSAISQYSTGSKGRYGNWDDDPSPSQENAIRIMEDT
jgi:hypothetical protein